MSILLTPLLLQALSVSVGDRTEVRLRNAPSAAETSPQVDTVTRGKLALRLERRRATWELAYLPQWTFQAIDSSNSSTLFVQGASLTGQLRLSRRTQLSFNELASYGQRNFRLLSVSAPSGETDTANGASANTSSGDTGVGDSAATQATLADRTIHYGNFTTNAALSHQLSRRWGTSTSASYAVSGGLDEASRLAYPQMKTVRATESLTQRISRDDNLSETVIATNSNMSALMNYYAASVMLGWSRGFGTSTTGSLSLGASYWVSVPEVGAERRGVLPMGTAAVASGVVLGRGRLSFSATQGVTPFVDRVLGTVYPRSSTSLTLDYTQGKASLLLSANSAFSFGSTRKSSRYSNSVSESIHYRVGKPATLEAGARQGVLGLGEAGPATVMWAVFLALNLSSDVLHF